MDARLSTHGLACRRGDRVLFSGLGFALGTGAALQIAGPNGIGKSSLIRILAGLLSPYAGTVERSGTTALVDERHALEPELPLGRALRFWGEIDGSGFLALESCGDRLGLTELLDVPVRYLSTGQKKRAALARLVAQQAPIWLLDEPLNGLDQQGAELAESLIAEHCSGGGIAVVASHQPIALPAGRQLVLGPGPS